MAKILTLVLLFLAFVVCAARPSLAQTTEFTFQGSLKDNAVPANGNYDFEFALFDALSAGSQIGATIPRSGVAVANGIFTVKLDFGTVFPGANRFLEIRVRLAGQPGITTLAPRQLVNSAPYSVKSLNTDNASQLGGVAANQYVVTTDPRLSDARNPLPNSVNYVQNSTTQQTADFNVSGGGTLGGTLSANSASITATASANIFNAASRYDIAGSRVLATTNFASSLFAGVGAGDANGAFGSFNSFFGQNAGQSNVLGANNSFFGNGAGQANTASGNSFFGSGTGDLNTSGGNNVFIGVNAGNTNTSGSNNTVIGAGADVLTNNATYATAIGAGAVAGSNSIKLGRTDGSDFVVIPGSVNIAGFLAAERRTGVTSIPLCYYDMANQIATCSSSLRYKTNVQTFTGGLNTVRRLRPITFDWKENGEGDIGFAAEEVAEVEPLLVTYNKNGEIEGVKYDRLSVAFVNAFKEQQTQIGAQAKEISEQKDITKQQQAEIDDLRSIICSIKPEEKICQK